MKSTFPLKRLFKTALLTSTIIGVIFLIIQHFIIIGFDIQGDVSISLDFPIGRIIRLFFIILGLSILVFIFWTINIMIFFLASLLKNHKVLPYFVNPLKFALSYGFYIFFLLLLSKILTYRLDNLEIEQSANILNFLLNRIFVLFMIINTIILMLQQIIIIGEKNLRVEKENANLILINMTTINEQLKKQIHPHFLFNSLTTLNSLIKTDTAVAEEYLIKLSSLLRKTINSDDNSLIKIADELIFCTNYLDMQKIRFGTALSFDINIPEDVKENGYVPFLAIQLLVENAIKHNLFTEEKPLHIIVKYQNNYITVINNINLKPLEEKHTGKGLKNLGERYKILAGEDIYYENNSEKYIVKIKVLKNENYNNRR